MCVNEKWTDPLLHTVALQFLSTIFTAETDSRGAEVQTSNSKPAAALSDIVNGPSASELCELLLQVWGGVVHLNFGIRWKLELSKCFFVVVDARVLIRGPFRTL